MLSCKSIGSLRGSMTYNHCRSSMMGCHESRTREVKHAQSIAKYYITAARQANKLTMNPCSSQLPSPAKEYRGWTLVRLDRGDAELVCGGGRFPDDPCNLHQGQSQLATYTIFNSRTTLVHAGMPFSFGIEIQNCPVLRTLEDWPPRPQETK